MRIGDICTYAPKSQIKAGEAIDGAQYMFFTSSAEENKRFSDYQIDGEGIIMGTGGNATLHYYSGKFSTSTDCVVLMPDEHVRCKYLYYFFKANMHLLEAGFKGAGLKHTNKAYISDIRIENIPTYEEQDRLILLMDKLQQVITHRENELVKLDKLIKARFVEMFGDPRINPFGYEKRPLGNTCRVITGNTPSRKVPEYYGDYIEWIKTDNILSGVLNPSQAAEYLSEKGASEGRIVDKNSILMACIAGSIASIGRVCVTDRTVAFNQQINAVVPERYDILFLYVLLQISKDYLIEDINMALKGILSKSKLEEKEFYVPPMELQEEFAEFVKQVDKSKVVVLRRLIQDCRNNVFAMHGMLGYP
ncbi:restriction endonuclease subunit S [Streptococcus ruminicola]|uniref:restriction endonuclease subunit S n=1 Tax=Streptococcus ruminicola TaxID=2686210 RepID=UPI0024140D65|nr:restriction endonuclease subunit S [Streptococcus ruminicola]WFM80916.1 restriction endonuclease subunit S [Streptococcus ruminicola]